VIDYLMSEAFIRGRRSGNALLSPALNPYPDGDPLHEQWRQGHETALRDRLAQKNRELIAQRAA
jgi:hypothetical protein